MVDIIKFEKTPASAKAILRKALATPHMTRCILIIDGEGMDEPLYSQHGMAREELAFYGAFLEHIAMIDAVS